MRWENITWTWGQAWSAGYLTPDSKLATGDWRLMTRDYSQATIQLVVASQACECMDSSGFSLANERCRMVKMTGWKPVTVFRVFDSEGRPIGEVVQPRFEPLVGRGAGTVLLVRGESVPLVPPQYSLLRI